MKKRNVNNLIMVIVFIIFVTSNMLVFVLFKNSRIDLTHDKIYTLSEGTKNVLNSVKGNITLKFFYSKTDAVTLGYLNNYAQRINDLLREYTTTFDGSRPTRAKSRIIIEKYDPISDSDEQELAERYALQPISMPGGMTLYFGLVGINDHGDEQVIPVFNPSREEFLEYDITRLIYNLANSKKKVIGVISSLPLTTEGNSWTVIDELKKTYDVKDISNKISEINSIDLLMIIHPKGLSDKYLFAIDQYIVSGKNALIFVDPHCEAEIPPAGNPMAVMEMKRDSTLNSLFNAWGIKMEEGKIAADLDRATNVNTGRDIVPYIIWLSLTGEDLAKNDVVTSRLESILLPSTGKLVITPVKGINYTTLIKTSKKAETIDSASLVFSSPEVLLNEFISGDIEIPLAVRINGLFKSAFSKVIKEVSRPSNVIIVTDADMLADRFCVETQNFLGHRIMLPINDNLNFVYNAVENLSGSNELISIRCRGSFARPFLKVNEIEANAELKWKEQEMLLSKKIEEINARLKDIPAASGKDKTSAIGSLINEEINKFRLERQNAQKKLRYVRLNLRQDKEALGNLLFSLNTFLVPLIISIIGVSIYINRKKKRNSP